MAHPIRESTQTLSDDAVRNATGRGWQEWFEFLDAQGWAKPTHQDIVAVLTELDIDGWWAQGVTVGYEQARGLRAPGQRQDGTFEISATRTLIATPAEALDRLIAAVSGVTGTEPVRISRGAKYPTARFALSDGEKILASTKPPKGDKTSVGITWGNLANQELVELRRAQAKELLASL